MASSQTPWVCYCNPTASSLMFLEHSVTAAQIMLSLKIKCFFNFCGLNFGRFMSFFLVLLDSPKILMIFEYRWIFDSFIIELSNVFRRDVQYDCCSLLCIFVCVWSSLFICEFQIVRWRETILKFKCLSATCTCFCRLSLSACLLQLLFQIFRDFLLYVHLTSYLPWFPNLVQTALFPELIFLVLTWIQGTCLLRCWLCLSTVCRVYSTMLSSDLFQ